MRFLDYKGGGYNLGESNAVDQKLINIQAEMCFIGALVKNLDLFVSYGHYMRSKYDFYDDATRFFYDNLEKYYTTFSQTIDEKKLNVFMSQNSERLKEYKLRKGWKTIQRYMTISDPQDIDNYFELIKKFSLLREYQRNGFPIETILNHKKFDSLTADKIYQMIRTKADRINTVINAGQEAVDLANDTTKTIEDYLERPSFGINFPWDMYDEFFLGMRKKKVIFEGLVSNAGKSRKLVMLAAHTVLIQGKPFLLLSNEMDEEDLKSCLITTVINNPIFQKIHGIKRNKPEREIVLGIYHDDKGEIIRRYIDDDGNYIESLDDFKKRVFSSKEYQDIKTVTDWIDLNKTKFMFKDIGNDYSIQRVEFELRKAKMVYGIEYFGYDTLKGYQTDEWSMVKQFATRIKEIAKELDMFGLAVFQLTDDTIHTDIFSLSSMNISTSKGMKHVCDILTLGKLIDKGEYHKYKYIDSESSGQWGEQIAEPLKLNCSYLGVKIDKNRAGNKDKVILFEINLDYNTWNNVGQLIKA